MTHHVVLSPAFTVLVLIKNLPSFENCPMFAGFGLSDLLLKISSNAMFCAFETAHVPQNRRERKNKSDIDKKKKLTGKPWYYIGEISNGYRPATQYEAIKAKKVSYYGKYVVNIKFWTIYRDYNILLDPNL